MIYPRQQEQKSLRRNPCGFVKKFRLLFGRSTEVETGKDREKKGITHRKRPWAGFES